MMAQSAAPFFAPPLVHQPAPPQDPFATPLTASAFSPEPESEREWEYEYSSTETETYYVTLDLTTPHVPPSRKSVPRGGRNRKMRWVNPGLGGIMRKRDRGKPKTFRRPGAAEDGTGNLGQEEGGEGGIEDEDEEDDSDTGGSDDDDQTEIGSEVEDGDDQESGSQDPYSLNPSTNETPREPSKVQILDLHSKNPVVSYEGHMYSCHWASNIGTELLFTRHDPDDPLPALRTLPGDVDLLAASSARITATSIELHPNERPALFPPTRQRGNVANLAIPVGRGASIHRRDQARFLESLMDIKEEKGEGDPVTVFSHKRKTQWKWNEQLNRKRDSEMKKLRSVARKGEKKAARMARERLAELERDGERRRELLQPRHNHGPEPGKNLKRRLEEEFTVTPMTPKRGRPARSGLGAIALMATPEAVTPTTDLGTPGEFGTPGFERDSMAASTPRRFERFDSEELDEMEDSEMEDEEMEEGEVESGEEVFYEEIEEDEAESGEELFYEGEDGDLYGNDEDAPGEDDDTNLWK